MGVRPEEGLVLRAPWQGLPGPGLRDLGRWLVCAEEAVVLRECWQGLPTAGRRLCLRLPFSECAGCCHGLLASLDAIFWRPQALSCTCEKVVVRRARLTALAYFMPSSGAWSVLREK